MREVDKDTFSVEGKGLRLATEKQVSFYESLCNQLGQEPDEGFENMTVSEASKSIDELKRMMQERKDKFEGKEDDCYWY